MGFIGFMGRMIQGKPAFEVQPPKEDAITQPAVDGSAPQPVAPAVTTTPVQYTPKVIPRVSIDRTICKENGARMDVYGHVYNHSVERVCIENIKLFNQTITIRRWLRPGEVHEYHLYSGVRLPNESLHTAYLNYQNEAGDYFCADHFIQYALEHDNTYSVKQFSLQQARDV